MFTVGSVWQGALLGWGDNKNAQPRMAASPWWTHWQQVGIRSQLQALLPPAVICFL